MTATLLDEPGRDLAPPAKAQPTGGIRADIQALRALAVVIVVIYHFFPNRLPGGFVGVDVFFAISGFLITSHLLSRPPKTGLDLAEFWGRRVRRLLPASFLVLGATLAGMFLLAPKTMWENIATNIAASVFYVENWLLAHEAVDYLAADDAPTPVQHFWSLSVEEQFYLVWPVLILAALWLVVRARPGMKSNPHVTSGIVIVVVVGASLLYSMWLTATDPAAAYFVTGTRIWELGLGALAACIFPWVSRLLDGRHTIRAIGAWIGLAIIAYSAFAFSTALPFPSYTAALPVGGTVLVLLAAAREGRLSPVRAMGWRPVQLTGDLSYSIYLWHWPALLFAPMLLDHRMSASAKVLLILVVFVVAWATKLYVEDPFRGRRAFGAPLRRTFVFALVGMLVIGGASAGTVGVLKAEQQVAEEQMLAQLTDPESCFGALALAEGSDCAPHGDELLTAPEFAAADLPKAYADDCWIRGDFSDQRTCHYGSDDPDAVKVALVGNSHGGHWLPTLQEIGKAKNWSITTYLISMCYTVDFLLEFETPERAQNCLDWNDRVISEVESGEYDLVVISNRTARRAAGEDITTTRVMAEEGYGRVLDRWSAAGVPVLVLKDTPYALDLKNVPDCVSESLDDLSECDGSYSDREQIDPLATAAAIRSDSSQIEMLDLTDRICRDDICYSVVGGVIVYFDRGHLSATFARSLAGDVWLAVDRLLAKAST